MSETRPAPETDAPPLAMQIALRVEKTAPPDELDACAAAAQACVGLLVEAERRAHPVRPVPVPPGEQRRAADRSRKQKGSKGGKNTKGSKKRKR